MKKLLTNTEKEFLISELARQNQIEIPVLRSIIEVESSGSGFYPDSSPFAGKCKVRFEPDYFFKFANSRPFFLPAAVTVEEAKKDSKYTGRLAYEQALLQSPNAAIKSSSFGLGQIMGFNSQKAGYNSLVDFSIDMEESEYYQISAMVKFICSNVPLLIAIQQRDFLLVAKLYNGNHYVENNYERKLKESYQKFYQSGVNV